MRRAKFDPETRAFSLRVPPGRVKLDVDADGYRQVGSETFEIGSGEREITIRMKRAAILVVRVRRGSRAVKAEVEVAKSDGESGRIGFTQDDGVVEFTDLEPGDYRVSLVLPERHGEPSSREVTLEAGKRTRLEFDLEK